VVAMRLSKINRLLVFFFINTFVILGMASLYVPKVVEQGWVRQ
jgi:hypothetical protein